MSFNGDSASRFTSKIPPSILGPVGDVIRKTIFNDKGNPTTPVRKYDPQEHSQLTSFSNFMADVRTRGVARSNRFIVIFKTAPAKMLTDRDMPEIFGYDKFPARTADHLMETNYRIITRSCESAAFPGENIQVQESRFQSHLAKFPVLRNQNETSWVFRCDNEMTEKKFFDLWSGSIISRSTGDVSYKSDYAIGVRIIQFNEQGKAIYAMDLEDFFPISVADMELSQAAGQDYHRINVTFSYSKIKISAIDEPDYSELDSARASTGKSLSTYDRITREIFKAGKNIILKEINKNVPIGNIPGIGNARDILGSIGL